MHCKKKEGNEGFKKKKKLHMTVCYKMLTEKGLHIVSQGTKKRARTQTKEASTAKSNTKEVSPESKTIAQRVCSANRRMHTPSQYQLSP